MTGFLFSLLFHGFLLYFYFVGECYRQAHRAETDEERFQRLLNGADG
jgi:hypothetical protein